MVILDVDHAGRNVPAGVDEFREQVDLGHLSVGEFENQFVHVEAEHRVADRPIRASRQGSAEVVPEAEVGAQPGPAADRLDGCVEEPDEVRRGVRVDRRRRLVDLDDGRTRVGEATELGLQDRHEGLRGCDTRFVDLAGSRSQPARERVRSGQGHLERSRRPPFGRGELRDDAETVRCRDRLEHLEAVLLIVAAGAKQAIGRQGAHAGQVAVELGGEEAGATHLAVRDHVDPGRFLVVDRQIDGIVEHLGQVGRAEPATLRLLDSRHEPGRMGVRPDNAGQELFVTHRSTSANANARAGLSTNSWCRISASRPHASIAALNSRRRYARPGDPPNAR